MPATFEKYDPPIAAGVKWYALVQFVAVLAGTLVALKAAEQLPAWQLAAIVFYVALSLSNLGSLLESAPWVRPLEIARLVTLIAAAAIVLLFVAPRFDAAHCGAAFGVSLGWLHRCVWVRVGAGASCPSPA